MFAVACINFVAGLIVEIVAVPPSSKKAGFKLYNGFMLTAALFHQLLWLPILVIWIIIQVTASDLGEDHKSNIEWMEWVVIFTEVAQYCRYIGVWGGYVTMFLLVFLSAYLLPVFKVQTGYLGTFGSGLGISFAYFVFAGVNVFVHEFFAAELSLWQLYFIEVVE